MRGFAVTALACAMTFLPLAREARAADTIETWDAGGANVEVYMLMDGFGHGARSQALGADLLAGWGLSDRLSVYLSTSLSADGYPTAGAAELALGVFGTPIDTDHFDVDLLLDICAAGGGLGEFCLAPGLELNYDAAPGGTAWGLYARAGLLLTGREADAGADPAAARPERIVDAHATLGAYLTLDQRRQLLLEFDMTFHDRPAAGMAPAEVGGVALGYNALLTGALELISQVRLDLPQSGERTSLGGMVGFIATLPGGSP